MNDPLPTDKSEDLLLGEAANEYFSAAARGEQPSLQEFSERFPQIASLIGEVFPVLALVGDSALAAGGVQPKLEQPEYEPPRRLGDYRLIREIGRGGMGIVYEAEQISLGRRVALKVLPFAAMLGEHQLKRFKNEARAAATLKHPHIVSVFSVGVERGVHYYAMELVEGQSLDRVLEQLRRKEPTRHVTAECDAETLAVAALSTNRSTDSPDYFRRVAELGAEAAEALAQAHQQGIIHRDVKPANLLLDKCGKLWVTDFGLARLETEAGLTMTGDFLGTLRYMSPEQALEEPTSVDQRADVYSLGVTLYELATLRPAYPQADRNVLLQSIAFGAPARPREINRRMPVDLETIIRKAIEKEPADRYRTAQELADDLRRFISLKPIQARPAGPLERLAKWSRRHVGAVWAMLAVVMAGAVLLAVSTAMIAQSRSAVRVALDKATLNEDRLSEALYAADIRLAAQAWKDNHMGRAVEVLEQHVPSGDAQDRRDLEWYFLRQRCVAEHLVIVPGGPPLYDFCFSPDGRRIAVGGKDSVLRLYDWQSKKLLGSRDTGQFEINGVAFVGTESVGTVGDDGALKLFDADSLRNERTIAAHQGVAYGIAYSAEKNCIVTSGHDGVIRLWEAGNGAASGELKGHLGIVNALALSADGQLLLSVDSARTTRVWDLTAKRQLHEFRNGAPAKSVRFFSDQTFVSGEAHGQVHLHGVKPAVARRLDPMLARIDCVAVSPGGELLAAGGDDGCVWLWRRTSPSNRNGLPLFEVVRTWKAHLDQVHEISFTSDGRDLVSAGDDGRLIQWKNVRDGSLSTSFAMLGGIYEIHSNAEQSLVAVAGNKGVGVADPRTGELVHLVSDRPAGWHDVAISADGQWVAAGVAGEVSLWRLQSDGWELRGRWKQLGGPTNPLFSPDSATLVVYGREDNDGLVLIDLNTLQKTSGLVRHGCNHVAWSPDGRYFAAAENHTDDILLYSAQSLRLLLRFPHHKTSVTALAFSPDSGLLASADNNRNVALWDLQQKAVRWTAASSSMLNEHAALNSLVFAPRGRTLLGLEDTGVITAWHVSTGRELLQFYGTAGAAEHLCLCDQGRRLCLVRSGRLCCVETGLPTGDMAGRPPQSASDDR